MRADRAIAHGDRAGWAAHPEGLRAQAQDPVETFLTAAGPMIAARLLATGDVPDQVLREYAETLLTTGRPKPKSEELLASFRRARVSTLPYAYALDLTGEATLELIEADRGGAAPVLSDEDWISLQGICEN